MLHRRIGAFFVFVLLLCSALFSLSAAEPAVQLKKITADVKEIVLYTNQVDPAVVNLAADPEDASLEGMELTVKKEGICSAELQGATLRVLPVSAGKTVLTVTVGKKKLDLAVKVLEPVTGLTLSSNGSPVPGGKVTFTAALEPKNAPNKQVEWSLEGGDGLISLDAKGRLTVARDCPIGTAYTVKCRALGSGVPVEAEISGSISMNLPKDVKTAFENFKNLPLPEPLQNLSLSGKGWIPATEIPQLAGIETVELTDNVLYIKTDRDIQNIFIVECDNYMNPSTVYGEYNSHSDDKIRSRCEARFQLQDPEKHHVIVTVFEDIEVNGKMQDFSLLYRLKLNPARLEPGTTNVYRILDLADYPPYTAKTASCHDLSANVYPDGSVSWIYYRFGNDPTGLIHFQAQFNNNRLSDSICLSRSILQDDVYADTWISVKGQMTMMTMSKIGLFFCRLRESEPSHFKLVTLKQKYPELEEYEGELHAWTIELQYTGCADQELEFITAGDLFTHEVDGSMVFHPDILDVSGNPFPWTFLEELIGPNTFGYPHFTE